MSLLLLLNAKKQPRSTNVMVIMMNMSLQLVDKLLHLFNYYEAYMLRCCSNVSQTRIFILHKICVLLFQKKKAFVKKFFSIELMNDFLLLKMLF